MTDTLSIRDRYRGALLGLAAGDALGIRCRVAALANLFQSKLWAAADPERLPVKRAKNELDLPRIAETYPGYLPHLPPALRARL
jgi:hypothetical protein